MTPSPERERTKERTITLTLGKNGWNSASIEPDDDDDVALIDGARPCRQITTIWSVSIALANSRGHWAWRPAAQLGRRGKGDRGDQRQIKRVRPWWASATGCRRPPATTGKRWGQLRRDLAAAAADHELMKLDLVLTTAITSKDMVEARLYHVTDVLKGLQAPRGGP